MSDWISESAPSLTDPAIRRILLLNHHSWKAKPATTWVHEPPPTNFTTLVHIEILREDLDLQCNSYGLGWEGTARQALLQWRWDNDREAVLAEDVVKKAQRRLSKQKSNALVQITCHPYPFGYFGQAVIPAWEEFPPQAAKEGCERIIHFIDSHPRRAPWLTRPAFVLKHLEKCVENLNDLDAQNNNFIETVEREDLVLLLRKF